MRSAYDDQNIKISVNNAVKDQLYFCPTCRKKVFIKTGERRQPHFCHYRNESCIDYWKYDETEWSNNWKDSFDIDDIEKTYNDHYIDVEVKNNLGIMFSSTSMHRETFVEKTDFMLENINNAMWLFNMTNLYEKNIIKPERKSIYWRNIWKMFSNYKYSDKRLWIVVEISVDNVRWFGILKDIDKSYDDKSLYIKRWLKFEQFKKYYNDIADKKDPEQPYIEEEERLRKIEEERQKILEQERIEREAEEERKRKEFEELQKVEYEKELNRIQEIYKNEQIRLQEEKEKQAELEKKQKEEEERKKIIQEENKKDYVAKCYANDPEMKRMSEKLSRLAKSDDLKSFSKLADEWYKRYGFAWIYSEFFH